MNKIYFHKKNLMKFKLRNLMHLDGNRFKNFSYYFKGTLFDFSRQNINKMTIHLLVEFAKNKRIYESMKNLFSMKDVNFTEKKPSVHIVARNMLKKARLLSRDVKIREISNLIRKGSYIINKCSITNVISIGIGGSLMGPMLCAHSLADDKKSKCRIHFVSGLNIMELKNTLLHLKPKNTICLINSKSFETREVIENSNIISNWYKLNSLNPKDYFFASTSNKKQAFYHGLNEDSIFCFDKCLCGRHSIWSSTSFITSIAIGYDNFIELLRGANAMDTHFRKTDLKRNIPFLMAIIGFWNVSVNNCNSHVLIPYSIRLQSLCSYVQQLEMESNGKLSHELSSGKKFNTSPVVWGGIGTDVQHTFMQMMHQGSATVSSDFIIPLEKSNCDLRSDNFNIFNCLSQIQSLTNGDYFIDGSEPYKRSLGSKPSTLILLNQLNPYSLGILLAAYEHKVYVQSILWGTNAFDQFGVGLGKNVSKLLESSYYSKTLENLKLCKLNLDLTKYVKK